MISLILLIFHLPLFSGQLQIQACCNGNCHSYEKIDDLFGVSCCKDEPFNTYTHICCDGVVRDRNRGGSYAELCCGTEVLGYDQTCCGGVVHNVINGDCCGTDVYLKSDNLFLCCDNILKRMITPTDVCCGSSLFDGGREQICCGKKVSSKSQFDSCCERNDGSVEEFNSSTHFCCNGAVAKGTQTACCYLRKNGKIVPQQYNTQNICCRFPYDELQTKINGQCIKLKG